MKKKFLLIISFFTIAETTMAKKPLKEIKEAIVHAEAKISVGGLYFHHRNPTKLYIVLSISVNTANENEIFINYRNSDDSNDVVWSRPFEDFVSMIDLEGTFIPKFTPVPDAIH
jgi:hypothetical protein